MTRNRRDRAMLLAVLLTGLSCWAASAAHASPDTGGALLPEVIAPATGGIGFGAPNTRSLLVRPVTLLGKRVNVRGTMPGAAHRKVILQRLDAAKGWRNVARGLVRSSERFLLKWSPDRSGLVSLRAVVAPKEHRHAGRASRAAALDAAAGAQRAPVVELTVYRPALASFYGPGFFGRQTACGGTLTPETIGVAHRRLPCGTLVLIMYRGRELTVPVIDRGPFSGTYSWDLTQATADALGFQTGGIGYVRVRTPPAAPAPAAARPAT